MRNLEALFQALSSFKVKLSHWINKRTRVQFFGLQDSVKYRGIISVNIPILQDERCNNIHTQLYFFLIIIGTLEMLNLVKIA